MDIGAINKAIFEQAKDIIVTWFSVITRGTEALNGVDMQASSTLLYALRFMFYMAVFDLVTHIPSIASMAAKGTSIGIGGALGLGFLAETCFEFLGGALILHSSMRLFGGKANLQCSVVTYCFLTAFLPIAHILFLPAQRIAQSIINQSPGDWYTLPQRWSRWDWFGVGFSLLGTTLVYVVFFSRVFQSFRRLHRLSMLRALPSFMLGLVGYVVFLVAVTYPFLKWTYQALSIRT
jgi:hypothetical protein